MNPRTLSWLLIGVFTTVLVALTWLPHREGQSIRNQAEQVTPDAPTPSPPGGIDARQLDRSKTDIEPPAPAHRPPTPPHLPGQDAPEPPRSEVQP